jgi:CheY-like chemotaxis protein
MQRARVLLAEDCRDAAATLGFLLERWGFQVCITYDGTAALAAAQTHAPDVAILDIGLPGLDGFAVAAALRQQRGPGELMLVALTGYGSNECLQKARQAGFDHYFVKPVAPAVLRALLAHA